MLCTINVEKFRDFLIKKNLSLTELANVSNLSTNAISNITAGRKIRLKTVSQICKALDCSPEEILS